MMCPIGSHPGWLKREVDRRHRDEGIEMTCLRGIRESNISEC